jgi:hypothetical protein
MLIPEILSAWERLLDAFRAYPKPLSVRGCPCALCLTDDQIRALLNKDQRQLAASGDVRTYVFNALGTIGTVEELTYLFPGLARIWAEKLDEGDHNDAYSEHFWQAMKREDFLAGPLPEPYRTAASTFLRTTILASLEGEGPLHRIKGLSRAHLWTDEMSRYAQASDDFPHLWNRWWEMPTLGHARTAVQYASCLVFAASDNPLFHRWTPLSGGGPPIPDETHEQWWIYWRDANLSFIRSCLTVDFLIASMERARRCVDDPREKQLIDAVLDRVRSSPDALRARIRALSEG